MVQSILPIRTVHKAERLKQYEKYKITNDDNRGHVKSLISASHAGKQVVSVGLLNRSKQINGAIILTFN